MTKILGALLVSLFAFGSLNAVASEKPAEKKAEVKADAKKAEAKPAKPEAKKDGKPADAKPAK